MRKTFPERNLRLYCLVFAFNPDFLGKILVFKGIMPQSIFQELYGNIVVNAN